jgi:hypothetical protein
MSIVPTIVIDMTRRHSSSVTDPTVSREIVMERTDELDNKRAHAVVGVIADMNDLIGTAAVVLSLEQDNGLQRELRRCAQVQDDRVLVVQLPIGGAGMELLPRGGTRPLRMDALRGAVSLEQLALENVTIQDRLRAKGSSVFQAAQAVLRRSCSRATCHRARSTRS